MDENFADNANENFEVEDNNANENLLSQSYIDGIQKVTGNDRASLLDFQIPPDLLEKRKRDWNALFEKYSSMVYEEEDDEGSAEQEKEEEFVEDDNQQRQSSEQEKEDEFIIKNNPQLVSPTQVTEEECKTKDIQRFPMRKPMSMVQYWVNTGNQPYATNNLEKSQSESGSSLAEECLESTESTNVPFEMINNSLEKNHETNESSRNMHFRIVSSSGSSVDTVAYVLANNNTTKKADTKAIMEGSRLVNKETLQPEVVINDIEKVKHSKKEVSLLDNVLNNLTSKKLDVNFSKNSSKNVETVDNINKSHKNKSQNQEDINRRCSNDSDESIFKSKYDFDFPSQNSVYKDDIENLLPTSIIENKTFKRKKLYNNSESLAEFTPISEDNTSQLTIKFPKKCEHPALGTPRISSRPSYLVRYRRFKLKTKRKSRISHSFRRLQSQKKFYNNSQNLLQGNSQTVNEAEQNSDQNLEKAGDCSYSVKMQENCKKKNNFLNKNLFNNSYKKAFNLKPLIIPLQRLPHRYYTIDLSSLQEKKLNSLNLNKNEKKEDCIKKSSQSLPSKDNESRALEIKSNNFQNFVTASQNLTSNDESHDIHFKSSVSKSQDVSSRIQKNNSMKSMNYIISLSSDDEPELSVSNLRQSITTHKVQKVSKETTRVKNTFGANNFSKKKLNSTNSKDDNESNEIRISDSNKIKNDNKKSNFKRKSEKEIKLVQSEKSKKTDISKNRLSENNSKPSFKVSSSSSKEVDKKIWFISSDEETIIITPKDSSVTSKLFEKRTKSFLDNKTLKEKCDETSSTGLTLSKKSKPSSNDIKVKAVETSSTALINEKQKPSSNRKKLKVSESKSSLKNNASVKNLRYGQDTSFSSEDELTLPLKPIFNGKGKLIASTV